MFWQVTGTVTKRTAHGEMTKQIPTFMLPVNVLGITDSLHAEEIARTVIDPFGEHEVHVYVSQMFDL